MSVTLFTAKEIEDLETKSTTPRFSHSLFGSIAIMALAFQWPSPAWYFQVGWTIIAAYSMFCWSSCFHETSHQGICGKTWVSVWLGRAIGTGLLVSYTAYREAHIRHHAYLNKPGDWELWPYSDPTTSLTFRRIFCWLEFPLGFFTSPFVYSRLCFSKNTPVKNPDVMRTMRIEYAVMAVFWAVRPGNRCLVLALDSFPCCLGHSSLGGQCDSDLPQIHRAPGNEELRSAARHPDRDWQWSDHPDLHLH